jgi:hypothetical protein
MSVIVSIYALEETLIKLHRSLRVRYLQKDSVNKAKNIELCMLSGSLSPRRGASPEFGWR